MGGLSSGRRYFYRFSQGRGRRERGTFETAPRPSANATIEFGWTGDTDATTTRPGGRTPHWNDFSIFRRMQAERNDFNIHFGDTIYSDSEVPNRLKPIALSVEQKWAKYKLNLGQPELTRLRGSAGFYSHWDDHEFVNDFAPPENQFSAGIGDEQTTVNTNGRRLYTRGVKAFRDYSPVSYTSRDGLYRTRRWGKNLELFFLDQRSFRSAKASAGASATTPAPAGPTSRPPRRSPHATSSRSSRRRSASRSRRHAWRRYAVPDRTYLGKRQLARFLAAVRNSDARFKVIMNELRHPAVLHQPVRPLGGISRPSASRFCGPSAAR